MKVTRQVTNETETRVKVKITARDDSGNPFTERSTERWYPKSSTKREGGK